VAALVAWAANYKAQQSQVIQDSTPLGFCCSTVSRGHLLCGRMNDRLWQTQKSIAFEKTDGKGRLTRQELDSRGEKDGNYSQNSSRQQPRNLQWIHEQQQVKEKKGHHVKSLLCQSSQD
jgi:hypothetical protein